MQLTLWNPTIWRSTWNKKSHSQIIILKLNFLYLTELVSQSVNHFWNDEKKQFNIYQHMYWVTSPKKKYYHLHFQFWGLLTFSGHVHFQGSSSFLSSRFKHRYTDIQTYIYRKGSLLYDCKYFDKSIRKKIIWGGYYFYRKQD